MLLPTAIQAAQAAGAHLRQHFTAPRTITSKGLRDIVTDADVAAQAAALAVIRAARPHDQILAEEGPPPAALDPDIPTWVIDPLDGTSNYARQFPCFGVSVGVMWRGVAVCGVIEDPLGDELFYAEQGRGAFLRRGAATTPLHVSPTTSLLDSLVGLDWAREPENRQRTLSMVNRVGAACLSLRCVGSAALGLAYVSAGRLDAYFHVALSPWDMAAGVALITCAGGQVSDLAGAPWHIGQRQIMAAPPTLHASLLPLLVVG